MIGFIFLTAVVGMVCILIVKGGNRFNEEEEWDDIKDNQ